jgi:hypothetical protein
LPHTEPHSHQKRKSAQIENNLKGLKMERKSTAKKLLRILRSPIKMIEIGTAQALNLEEQRILKSCVYNPPQVQTING